MKREDNEKKKKEEKEIYQQAGKGKQTERQHVG